MKNRLNKQKGDQGVKLNECRRCGICCSKGGPALHVSDMKLIESGRIPLKFLYTIRKNEPVRDNVKGKIEPAGLDIIKIKGQEGSWTCSFLDMKLKRCTIYEHRPLECRVLKCWDTQEIEEIYDRDRLSRENFVSGIKGLWELIQDHEDKCSYQEMTLLIQEFQKAGKKKNARRIIEMVEYDTQIRNLLIARGDVDPELLDFLFGRPLHRTIRLFGLKVKKSGNDHILKEI